MWELIKELFDKDKHAVRRVGLAFVLGMIALFAVWKSVTEPVRTDLLRRVIAWYDARTAPPEATIARNAANQLEADLPAVSKDVAVQYFSKAVDSTLSARLIALLRQRGLRVSIAVGPRRERSNAVWCGSQVVVSECVLVALRMVQSGLPVTQVFRYPPDHDRPTLIQIGYNDNLGALDSYSVRRLMALVRNGVAIDNTPH